MRDNGKDPVQRKVEELLAPTNLKEYQKVLNTPVSKDKSDKIDIGLKIMQWELQELKDLKDASKGLFVGDRVKIVNSTNKTIEDCIGIIVDLDAQEDITLYLVQITQITTKAIKSGFNPEDTILVHPDELERL